MSVTEGASARSAGDQVLDTALSEMASEGGFNATATLDDLGSTDASQPVGDVSAAPAAAPATPGESGSDDTRSPASPVASPTTPAAGAAPAATDPLAGTEPFTYSVNGGPPKTLEGVYRVPGEGLLVPEQHVGALQQLAERAEVLDRVTREITDQNATYERLSQWTVRDAAGKEQTLTGSQGLEARFAQHARTSAALEIADAILGDPAKLLSLLAKDAQGNIVVDPAAVETLSMRAQLAADAAEKTARQQFSGLSRPPAPTATAPQSFAAEAPRIVQMAAGASYDKLTAEDRTLLAGQLDRYVRPATEADRRANPLVRVGSPIVDDAFAAVVRHLASQRQTAAQAAKVAETAGKHNAGMDKGRQPAAKAPAPVTPPAAKQPEGRKRPDWDGPLSTALAEMGIT